MPSRGPCSTNRLWRHAPRGVAVALGCACAWAGAAALAAPASAASGAPGFSVTVRPLLTSSNIAGSWQVLPYRAPGLSVHATLMNNGKVLIVEGSGNDPNQFNAGTFNIWVWDPGAGTFTLVPQLPFDLFCGGHALLANGKVLFIGGTSAYPTSAVPFHLGTKVSYEFDPSTGTFTQEPNMQYARWYPTALEQGDGSVLAVSGSNDTTGATVPYTELFNPFSGSWSTLAGQQWFPLYPNLTLLANGQVFYSGSASGGSASHQPGVWSPVGNGFTGAPSLQNPTRRDQAASILLPPAQAQKIAVFGGGNADDSSASAVNSTDVFNLANPSAPTHANGISLATAKMHVLGVILPDETVFETAGSQRFAAYAVAESAIYRPSNGLWSQMNPPTVPRSYHAEAILLPSGQVATLGSNPLGFAPETRIEVFSPPYLFKGQRPVINYGPSQATYGGSYGLNVTLAPSATLSHVVIIHPASVTHSDDPNQRLVELPFTGTNGNFVVTVPSNPNLTPPGWYMLFADDNQGRPSVASWVHIS